MISIMMILLLSKGVYAYKCKDDSGKFNKTALPAKEDIYSNLNMEVITG